MTITPISGILESTKKQLHHGWFAACTGLVFGLAILILLNSISVYRWVSRPISIERPRVLLMHAPVATRTAVYSSVPRGPVVWSLRRSLEFNLWASLALVITLTLLSFHRRV